MTDDTDWSLMDFGDDRKGAARKAAPSAIQSPVKACPKCGRELGRGGHFHVKACKGDDAG